MAIYHLSVKTISRSSGRSAVAAAAYRAGVRLVDPHGAVHDYSRRRKGIGAHGAVMPKEASPWATDRAAIWQAAERAEKRRDAVVAREIEVALPHELPRQAQRALVEALARALVGRHGVIVDWAIHRPREGRGDPRNHHAHLLMTTRRATPQGLGEKTREWDAKATGPALVTEWRARWAKMVNEALLAHGVAERVDHRSLAAQGLQRPPGRHLGPAATGYERRTGTPSRRRAGQAPQGPDRAPEATAQSAQHDAPAPSPGW